MLIEQQQIRHSTILSDLQATLSVRAIYNFLPFLNNSSYVSLWEGEEMFRIFLIGGDEDNRSRLQS